LLGDKNALKTLTNWLEANRANLAFGIATGRPIESAVDILKKNQVNIPDVLVTSVGTEIHYGKKLVPDLGWAAHIRYKWRKDALAEALSKFPGLVLQAPENQREFKLSYIAKPDQMPLISELYNYLHDVKLTDKRHLVRFCD